MTKLVRRVGVFIRCRPLGITLVALALLSCGGGHDGPAAPDVLHPGDVRYSGRITVEGRPHGPGLLYLAEDVLNPENFELDFLRATSSDAGGAYDISWRVDPERCDRLWLAVVVETAPGAVHRWYNQSLLDGCGEHTLDIDAGINVQLSGRITVDGSPHVGIAHLATALRPTPTLRRFWNFYSNSAGEFELVAMLDPSLCGDLWLLVDLPSGTRFVQTAVCGEHTFDWDITN